MFGVFPFAGMYFAQGPGESVVVVAPPDMTGSIGVIIDVPASAVNVLADALSAGTNLLVDVPQASGDVKVN